MNHFSKHIKAITCSYLKTLIICSVAICVVLPGNMLYSQPDGESIKEFVVKNYTEDLYVSTDRNIYFSGEQVWLKVYMMNGLNHIPSDISIVVYVELLDQDMFPLKQIKVKAEECSGSTYFILPDDIRSGNYLIRAYTNWMKNRPAELFCYNIISVINPFESIDHLSVSSETQNRGTDKGNRIILPKGLSELIVTDAEGNQISEKYVYRDNNQNIKYTVSLSKEPFIAREKVKVEISASDMSGNPLESDFSISIAKSVLVDTVDMSSFNSLEDRTITLKRKNLRWDEITNSNEENFVYLPEREGQLISGVMRSKSTGEPVKNTDISLAFIGKSARCHFTKTDENGVFYFIVNETGLNEIVIQPLFPETNGFYVELNQSFSNKFRHYPLPVLYIDSSRISDINSAIIAMQINNIYKPFRQNSEEVIQNVTPDFYGKPENTVIMSDYIELTSVREVVKEIIPNVFTLKQNGKYDFKLVNKLRGQPFDNKPLILVDGVPVFDVERVLNISSKEIERADIINIRYFFSENVFDGIVSFITTKGNLSAMEFDNSIFRQVYEGYQKGDIFYSPDYSTDNLKENRIPDFRNTLYWNPDMHTGQDGKTVIEFYTSDETGGYTILVEGITPDGKTGRSTVVFEVK